MKRGLARCRSVYSLLLCALPITRPVRRRAVRSCNTRSRDFPTPAGEPFDKRFASASASTMIMPLLGDDRGMITPNTITEHVRQPAPRLGHTQRHQHRRSEEAAGERHAATHALFDQRDIASITAPGFPMRATLVSTAALILPPSAPVSATTCWPPPSAISPAPQNAVAPQAASPHPWHRRRSGAPAVGTVGNVGIKWPRSSTISTHRHAHAASPARPPRSTSRGSQ